MQAYAKNMAVAAKQASILLNTYNTAQKNTVLEKLAQLIQENSALLIEANSKDIVKAQERNLDAAFIDRLRLTPKAIDQMIIGLKQIIDLPDPIGEILNLKVMPSGINVGQMRVPLGVIAIIYEARPNVTIDAAALCLKSGNACILRGGSEALHSNQALSSLITQALKQTGLSENAVQVVAHTDREVLTHLVTLKDEIDIVVPRGGKSLIEFLMQHSKIPMIKHLDGICHSFVDEFADIEKALTVCDNAKTQRYAPCNTMETLLIHQNIASTFLPKIADIYHRKNVELRACSEGLAILKGAGFPAILATEEDWRTEYLAPIISIKIVESLEAAIAHINKYGSHHTDAILTEHYSNSMKFLREADSASVMINASTRFADGFEYGLGAEIGISNDKLHARGPVGLNGLTSLKYVVFGHGEIRQ